MGTQKNHLREMVLLSTHSKEPSQRDGSFEHAKKMFKLMDTKKILFIICAYKRSFIEKIKSTTTS